MSAIEQKSSEDSRPLIIFGTGNLAVLVSHYIERYTDIEIAGFCVESEYLKSEELCGIPVIAYERLSERFGKKDVQVIIAIGPNKSNSIRERFFDMLVADDYDFFTLISPRAHVWDNNAIGAGTIIFDGCIVEPLAEIGANVVMWSGSLVSHHSVVGDHAFLAPAASVSGGAQIGEASFLGINSTIRDHVVVAPRTIVGAGAVIKKDTVANGVYSAKGTDLWNTNGPNTHV